MPLNLTHARSPKFDLQNRAGVNKRNKRRLSTPRTPVLAIYNRKVNILDKKSCFYIVETMYQVKLNYVNLISFKIQCVAKV